MQIYNIFRKILILVFPMKTSKKTSSKVAHNRPPFFFQYCQPAQNQPKSHILFHKNGSLRDFYDFAFISLLSTYWTPSYLKKIAVN